MKTTQTSPSRRQSKTVTPVRVRSEGKHCGPRKAEVLADLALIHLHAAGIDIGSAENMVCVPARSVGATQSNVRAFGVFTQEQDDLVEWLKDCGVTTVAMEATGIYWLTLYDKIESAGLEVLLVDPHSVRHVPGRKSDVLDCQWLQQLHTYGLLRGAFRPAAAVRRLRTLSRHRADLVAEGGSHLQQAQKALLQMNVQLPLVVSDINGETGLRIIEAILRGERDPQALVKLRDPHSKKSTVAEMAAALNGHYTEELLFVLPQNIEAWKFYQQQMEACDHQIEAALKVMASADQSLAPAGATQACAVSRTWQSRGEKEAVTTAARQQRTQGGFQRADSAGVRRGPDESLRLKPVERVDDHF